MKKIFGMIISAVVIMNINSISVYAEEKEESPLVIDEQNFLIECVDKDITEIVIPDNVVCIGFEAFKDCTHLKSVVIPPSVKAIDGAAFYNCRNLESVEMTNSVEFIAKEAFAYCPNLKSFTASVNAFHPKHWNDYNNFEHDIFGVYDENQFNEIEFINRTKDVNLSFAPYDEENTLYYTMDEICGYPHEIYPLYVQSDSVSSIFLPDYVLSLGDWAIDCPNLKEIHMNNVFHAEKNFIRTYSDDIEYSEDVTAYFPDMWFIDDEIILPYRWCLYKGLTVCNEKDNIVTKIGDVNCDKEVDIRDVTTLNQYFIKATELSDTAVVSADVTFDDITDISDLGQLKKYILGLVDSLSIQWE